LRSIMDKLGHTKIDVLKMDIEGAEHESYRRWLQTRQLIRWIIF
jgi:hypothetical protein